MGSTYWTVISYERFAGFPEGGKFQGSHLSDFRLFFCVVLHWSRTSKEKERGHSGIGIILRTAHLSRPGRWNTRTQVQKQEAGRVKVTGLSSTLKLKGRINMENQTNHVLWDAKTKTTLENGQEQKHTRGTMDWQKLREAYSIQHTQRGAGNRNQVKPIRPGQTITVEGKEHGKERKDKNKTENQTQHKMEKELKQWLWTKSKVNCFTAIL